MRRPGLSQDLKSCSRCGLPETYETLEINAEGICNICLNYDYRESRIDWSLRKSELEEIVNRYRGRHDYDAIVPFSGGKDSTFTLWYLVKQLHMKPLVVQFDHGFMRPGVKANVERTIRALGVEVQTFRPNWQIVKRLMLESLRRKGDFCWHCHTGIFAYPMWVALRERTPLVIWGEPSSEYTAYYQYSDPDSTYEEVDETRFNRFVNLGITAEDMAGMIQDFSFDPRDLKPFSYPPRDQLEELGYRSICLGSYIPWDTREQSRVISKELNWQGDQVEGMPEGLYTFEKIECWMQGSRDYIKFLKRGYGRVTQMTALDRRYGAMDSETAESLIKENEGKRPASLDLLLDYVGLTEEEFNELITGMAVPPHEPFFPEIRVGLPAPDHDSWFREHR